MGAVANLNYGVVRVYRRQYRDRAECIQRSRALVDLVSANEFFQIL